ncbi:MAG: DNA polymerase/3'-5' exonuclease PolX [Thermoanaerobaculia bacterium]
MTSTDRNRIAAILRETGELLELQGENPFKVRAYENAARAIEGLADDPAERLAAGTLAEVRGIGPALAGHIAEILHTGELSQHRELKAAVPPGVVELFRVPGLGPKKIRVLVDRLQVASPADLERACRDDRVARLEGFGEKSQARILEGLEHLKKFAERHLFPEAWSVAQRLRAHLAAHAAVERVEIAGSLRRRAETIGDLDLVAAVADRSRQAVGDHFLAFPEEIDVIGRGDTKISMMLASGMQADLRLVEPAEFASALHHFTGSKAHNIQLRGLAKDLGLTLNEYGLFRGERRLRVESEADIYRQLKLAFVPPEMREGLDELDLAARDEIPELLEESHLRGTLHVHTDASDGIATLAEMVAAARERGWAYLGIADHSRAAAYAGGLTPARVEAQWRAIDQLNADLEGGGFRIFKGTECDILADGALDFDDELLLGFDFVVASIHSRFNLSSEAMTARLVRAVSHPCVTFLGHPTGRLLLQRDGYAFDMETVLDAAAANGVVVELNANPHRLDLDWRHLRGWLRRGQITSIHPDAHSTVGLDDVRHGVGVARKAGSRREDVLNTRTAEQLASYFAARRERARALLAPG